MKTSQIFPHIFFFFFFEFSVWLLFSIINRSHCFLFLLQHPWFLIPHILKPFNRRDPLFLLWLLRVLPSGRFFSGQRQQFRSYPRSYFLADCLLILSDYAFVALIIPCLIQRAVKHREWSMFYSINDCICPCINRYTEGSISYFHCFCHHW